MQQVHNINEDWKHFKKRKSEERMWSNIHLLFLIGLILLISAFLFKDFTMGIIGIIVIICWFFFFRSQLSPKLKYFIKRDYPLYLIALSILLYVCIYLLTKTAYNIGDINAGKTLMSFSSFAFILFIIGIIILIYRVIKKKRKKR